MKVPHSLVITSITISIIFGLIAQDMLMAKEMGFSVAVVSLLFMVAFLFLRARKVIDHSFKPIYLVVPICVAIYGFSVPDSRGLDFFNLSMVMLSIGYCALRACAGRSLTLVESIVKVPPTLAYLPFSGMVLPCLADWSQLSEHKRLNVGRGVLVGGIAAVPFLAVFGTILAQADPVFGKLFSFDLSSNPEFLVQRLFLFSSSSAFVAGFTVFLSKSLFRRMNIALALQPDPARSHSYPIGPTMTDLESAPQPSRENEYVAMFVAFFGMIAALFFVFVLVQLRYLFGGDSVVLQTEGLTYADYARRGFLEIAGVTGVCLPMILFSQYALRTFDLKARRTVNIIVIILVSLLTLLLASAALRLKLYVGAYGLSPLRVYVAAGMVWLLVLFVAYLWHGTKWQLDRIGKIIYASMVAITMGLNLARPDYWIARVNLTRSEQKDVDPDMIIEAGADAKSAIEAYGKGKKVGDNDNKDFLSAFKAQQEVRSHEWKSLTVSQIMLFQK